jgi:hypothetical protein
LERALYKKFISTSTLRFPAMLPQYSMNWASFVAFLQHVVDAHDAPPDPRFLEGRDTFA